MRLIITVLSITFCLTSWAQSPRECNWGSVTESYAYEDILHAQLPKDQIEAIRWYGGTGGYRDINGYLRSALKPKLVSERKLNKHIRRIDTAISASIFEQDCYLYRGINLSYRNNKSFEAGEVINDKAFLSTSIKRSIADSTFARTDDQTSSSLLLIYNNVGMNALLIGNGEAEVLLPRNQYLKVIRSITVGNKNYALVFRCRDVECSDIYEPDALPAPFNL